MNVKWYVYALIFGLAISVANSQTRLQMRRISDGTAFEPQICVVLQLDSAARQGIALAANYVIGGSSQDYFSKNMVTASLGYSYYFSPRIYAGLNYNLRYLPLSAGSNLRALRSSQIRMSLGHDGKIGKTDFIKNFSSEYCSSQSKFAGWFFKLSTTLHHRFGPKWGSSLSMEAGIFSAADAFAIQDQNADRTFSLSRFRIDAYYQMSKNMQFGLFAQRHTAYFNILALSDDPNLPAANAYYPTNFVYSHIGFYLLIQIPKIAKNNNAHKYWKQQYRYLYAQPEFLFF